MAHLYGTHEIAQRLGRTRQRVQQLTQDPTFPTPYDTLHMGSVWRIEDIEAWIATHRPHAGTGPSSPA